MAYNKPNVFVAKLVNPIISRFGLGGTTTVTVAGRRSGEPRSVPVNVIELDGVRYLVSTRGESEWVRNVRAAGEVTLTRKGSSETAVAQEVPVAERGPVLRAYQDRLGRTVAGYFEQLPDDADHPVFALRRP